MGRVDEAVVHARSAVELAPGPRHMQTLARLLAMTGKHCEATELLEIVLAGAPDRYRIRFRLASSLHDCGDNAGALRELNRAREDAAAAKDIEVLGWIDAILSKQ